ncbi:hypothetical protein KHQ81_07720 [Mycoplasmatota bacterium]|nr:hypothetical protein KHQ81_07720 [Mycoplasmatota bacterium]
MLNLLAEEKEFYAQIIEQIEKVEKNGRIILTKFLSLREQEIITDTTKFHRIKVLFEGGYENAERKRCFLYPDTVTFKSNFNITCFKIEYNKRYLKINHQNVLGTLMSLQIDRALFGDIVFSEEECYFFISSDIEPVILLEFNTINKVPITLERHVNKLDITQKFLTKEIIISSMRIDNLISHVYNLSRDNAKQMVLSSYVYKNYRITSNPAVKCEINDVVSVRKHGRFTISKMLRKTKSDKFVLEIKIPTS